MQADMQTDRQPQGRQTGTGQGRHRQVETGRDRKSGREGGGSRKKQGKEGGRKGVGERETRKGNGVGGAAMGIYAQSATQPHYRFKGTAQADATGS